MTREEAIALLNEQYETCKRIYDCSADQRKSYPNVPQFMEALGMALTALRPVSREQMEKVWSGCEACKNAGLAIGEVQFYGPFEGSIDVSGNMQHCPNCGRPITPAAQERQLERLEVLKDGTGD